MSISDAELTQYWAIIDEINRYAQADFVALWRQLEREDKDTLFRGLRDGVPEIVELYRNAQADAAMVFYESTQGVAYDRAAAVAAGAVNEEQVEAALRYAVFAPGVSSPVGIASGVVQKLVLDGGREYATQAFGAEGWFRAARPDACAFCQMLATRAATDWRPYTSADAAMYIGRGKTSRKGPSANQYHGHCRCIPVRASEYQPPDYVEEWTETYYKAVREADSTNYRAVLSTMRQMNGTH